MKNRSLILIMFVFIAGFYSVSKADGQGMWSQAVGQLRHAIDSGHGSYFRSSARTRFAVQDFIFSDSASAKYVACAETVKHDSFATDYINIGLKTLWINTGIRSLSLSNTLYWQNKIIVSF